MKKERRKKKERKNTLPHILGFKLGEAYSLKKNNKK